MLPASGSRAAVRARTKANHMESPRPQHLPRAARPQKSRSRWVLSLHLRLFGVMQRHSSMFNASDMQPRMRTILTRCTACQIRAAKAARVYAT